MQIQQSQRGFTMIELMIALVVGLIVSGAAVALVAAMGKSNSDTVRATRLTQELRATVEVIARDMRRARSDTDPIANVSTDAATMLTACNAITPATGTSASCATYGYDCSSATAGTFSSVGLVGTKVYLKQATGAAPACPTNADILISSSTVNITALTFNRTSDDVVTISVAGQLALNPGVNNSVTLATGTNFTRTFSQEIRIRSAQVK
jgi:type IV pilus assembly protein PilW